MQACWKQSFEHIFFPLKVLVNRKKLTQMEDTKSVGQFLQKQLKSGKSKPWITLSSAFELLKDLLCQKVQDITAENIPVNINWRMHEIAEKTEKITL
jgi:hypothetical protein